MYRRILILSFILTSCATEETRNVVLTKDHNVAQIKILPQIENHSGEKIFKKNKEKYDMTKKNYNHKLHKFENSGI